MEELLLLAKDKEFQPRTFSTMWTFRGLIGEGKKVAINKTCESNLLNEIQKWLREVHKIHINTQMLYQCNVEPAEFEGWIIYIVGESFETNYEINKDLISRVFKSYEEALEYGLLEMLKLIK